MRAATPSTFTRYASADDAMMRAVMPSAAAMSPKDEFDYVRSLPLNRDVLATARGTRLVRPADYVGYEADAAWGAYGAVVEVGNA